MSQTDNELLALAAKAAGMPKPFDCNGVWSSWVGTPENGHWWDPLTDDGDALRLAAQCKLVIHFWDDDSCASVAKTLPGGDDPDDGGNDWISEPINYRRAIVRVAAEIGRSMP